jgi:hypothetical protein
MKTPSFLLPVLCAGLATSLVSCVDPYYTGGGSVSTTVTQYRPGYTVDRLPSRYDTEIVGGVRYYRQGNVYYRPQGNRYVVVDTPRNSRGWNDRNRNGRPDRFDGPQRGRQVTVIERLPRGYRTVNHRGTRYYQYGNTYYQSRGSGYVVVNRPY